MRERTIEELEKDRWPPPTSEENWDLIVDCHRLRKVPLQALSIADIVRLLNQEIGSEFIVDEALHRLREDPFIEGDYFEGDLLAALVRRAAQSVVGGARREDILRICSTCLSNREASKIDNETAHDIESWMAKLKVKTEPNQPVQTRPTSRPV